MYKSTLTLGTLSVLTLALVGCNQHMVKGVDYQTEGVCSEGMTVEIVRPELMLVLDKSGSMAQQTWDDDDDPASPEVTRWSSLHDVVDGLLEDREQDADFGAVLFPSVDAGSFADACVMSGEPDVSVGPGTRAAIMDALPPADSAVEGGTPATAGIDVAVAHLDELGGERPKAMILVTDGAANCMAGTEGEDAGRIYDENLPVAVAQAYEELGIPTFVIGIDIRDEIGTAPNANPYEKLEEVAIAGGKPREEGAAFFDVRSALQLQAALEEITGSLSCEIELAALPGDPEQVLVSVDGETQDEVDDCGAQSGWRWLDGHTVEMCGAACEQFQATGKASVDFLCE